MPIIMACDTAVAFIRKRCPMVDWIRNASRILRWLTGARQRTRLASGHEVRFYIIMRDHTLVYITGISRHWYRSSLAGAIRTTHSHWNNGHSILSRDHLIINHFCSNNTCFFSTTTIHLPIDRARFRLEPWNCLCVKQERWCSTTSVLKKHNYKLWHFLFEKKICDHLASAILTKFVTRQNCNVMRVLCVQVNINKLHVLPLKNPGPSPCSTFVARQIK